MVLRDDSWLCAEELLVGFRGNGGGCWGLNFISMYKASILPAELLLWPQIVVLELPGLHPVVRGESWGIQDKI